jgi:hypothetical protein
MAQAFHRCSHCRGFYEIELDRCKYCQYTSPHPAPDGAPRLFADRETCRALQIAEWEQLPESVRTDPMGPPPDEHTSLCECLHCGREGPLFEAIEMRWMPNEHMWACPCTTCGGRGFHFDIYPMEHRWECVECGHKWAPPGGNAKASNCKCPQCGCTQANGWFDDEYSEEEIAQMTDEQYKEAFGQTREEEEKEYQEISEKIERQRQEKIARGEDPDQLPFADDQAEPYDPEAALLDEQAAAQAQARGYPVDRMPDDIDFPRNFPKSEHNPDPEGPDPLSDDDIPR